MPWCETCSKFWTPTSVGSNGACPDCGRVLDAPPVITAKNVNVRKLAGEDKVPWHFKLMVGALAVYLGWRVIQLVIWLVR